MRHHLSALISDLTDLRRRWRDSHTGWSPSQRREGLRDLRDDIIAVHRSLRVLEHRAIRELREYADTTLSQHKSADARRTADRIERELRDRQRHLNAFPRPGQHGRTVVGRTLQRSRRRRNRTIRGH